MFFLKFPKVALMMLMFTIMLSVIKCVKGLDAQNGHGKAIWIGRRTRF
jgi:hypothetical protein